LQRVSLLSSRHLEAACVASALLAAPCAVGAQQTVVLANGSQLNGRLANITDTTWLFRMAGVELKLALDSIASFVAFQPVGLRLRDGTVLAAAVLPAGDSLNLVAVDGPPRRAALRDLAAVGWPNRDLNVGAIVALSLVLPEAVKTVLRSWGPGRYDAYFNQDGVSDPVLIPPAYGLRDVALETYTGEGPVSYWNNYVAVTQMHGQGSFSDPRLGIDIVAQPDRVTPKLPVLRDYQLTLETPAPPPGSFDPVAAERGRTVFNGPARCATCHIPPTVTDAGFTLHAPSETGMDPVRATRGANGGYRTTPLRGAWQRAPYFHDGHAATLAAVVDHYAGVLGLSLTAQQKTDLVEYLKSL